jgi:hypothetical protein
MEAADKRDPRERANKLLLQISAFKEQLAGLEARAEAELKAVRERYEKPVKSFGTIIGALEEELIKLMKKHAGTLFDGTDQVDLENGTLLHGQEEKVKIPRNAAELIELLGWEDGLKRSVGINRETIEKWPDERLVQIRAERKTVEVFDYELKNRDA